MITRRGTAPLLRSTALISRPFTISIPIFSISNRSFTSNSTCLANYRRFGDPKPSTTSKPYLTTTSNNFNGSNNPFNNFRNRFRKPPAIILIIGGGSIIYYIAHLEKVELTGRRRFMDVSDSTEKEMGVQSFNEIMQQYQGSILPHKNKTHLYVQSVARRIVEASGLAEGKNMQWECHVVQDDSNINAFVLPTGKIFVFTGILPICANENGLAVVLGHEIAHQVARHSAERMSSMKILFGLSILLNSLGLDVGISRIVLNLFLTLPNSRTAEMEADYIGLKLANKACFDPREAENLWKRMERAEKAGAAAGGSVDFLSTHPSSSKRVVKVREWAKEVMLERPSQCGDLENQFGSFMQSSSKSSSIWRQ